MSEYQQKDLTGVLFKNDNKTTDNLLHPDYKGNCLVDGIDYYMSAWIKESKNGRKYMSFSFTPKASKVEPGDKSFTQDIPF